MKRKRNRKVMKKKSLIFRRSAFTLIEIMVVVVLLGILLGFSIPNFAKSMRKAHEKDAISQLSILHAANHLYLAQEDEYLDSQANLNDVNDALKIHIMQNEMIYEYDRNTAQEFTATAEWTGAGGDFTVKIDQNPVDVDNGNPCCSDGDCPTLSNC